MKNNENGRSMVEMLGVLAIIGVLSAGGLAGYSKAMFKHKLNSTMDQITMLVTNIRTMYGTQGNYSGLQTDAINLGIIPSVMGTAMNALTNPFKGGVTITTVNARGNSAANLGAENTENPTGFVVSYSGLPTEACIALATTDFGSGAGSGFISVGVGATHPATPLGYIGSNEGKAYDMSAAITACNANGVADNATVSWYFY